MKIHESRVLVTGAGGFIGSHLVEALVREGAAVRAFVRYTSRGDRGLLRLLPAEVKDAVEHVAGDLRDPQTVREAVQSCDMLFHLGALISVAYSFEHPREAIETNIMGTLNVLEAARDADVGLVVHTSTSECYGTAQCTPMSEAHPLQSQSPYAASKTGADKIAQSFFCAYGLPVVTLRPFNTYGPRQSGRAVIPTILHQAFSGTDIELGNLHPRRDFTFVTDTVKAFLLCPEAEEAIGTVTNIGSGDAISIGGLVELVRELFGIGGEVRVQNERKRPDKAEVDELVCDNTRARTVLGWTPSVSLREGLTQTADWIRDHMAFFAREEYQR